MRVVTALSYLFLLIDESFDAIFIPLIDVSGGCLIQRALHLSNRRRQLIRQDCIDIKLRCSVVQNIIFFNF